ncbi:hypothetical protein BD779DRAFT_1507848 [Infundibulicybe gibba]|nr:hypothetical protein BD779DRAFT_1507848 [Infundibulicybe gibba]
MSALATEGLQVTLEHVTPLRTPRRRLQVPRSNSTGDFNDQPFALSSNRHRATKTHDTESRQIEGKTIRPLPPLPKSPPPPPPLTPPHTKPPTKTHRPLPSPPPPPPPSPHITPTLTPAPIPPRLLHSQSVEHLRPLRPLTLRISPPSPDIPQAPSPITAKRKRISKLRRYLGERVPNELVFGHCQNSFRASLLQDKLQEIEKSRIYTQVDQDSDYDSDVSDDDMEQLDYRWALANGTTVRTLPMKRFSKRWYREQGGRRWEEDNFQNVLATLRNL